MRRRCLTDLHCTRPHTVALLTATLQDICEYEKQRLLTILRNEVRTPSLPLVHSLALYSLAGSAITGSAFRAFTGTDLFVLHVKCSGLALHCAGPDSGPGALVDMP